ncbi:MAG: response regulator transcription factor [Austwickia sp.]|nr:response regulator transcription factor [Austwickia sp.]MBK8437104.1 response regulator transcription factor [Austwickia sp.]MBK9102339.1 response regulator transcription factor [Austwickia sp.]
MNDYEVVVFGLARMFEGYADRVRIVELSASVTPEEPVDVAMYDTFAGAQADGDGLREAIEESNANRVVVYTWNLDAALVDAALAQGARGYLAKSLPAAELVAALERVRDGEIVVSDTPDRAVTVGGDWPGRAEGLTNREAEVIALITQGLSNHEIAVQTHLSINSVKSYIRTAYRKMGVTSRSQAVLWGVEHGFRPDRRRVTFAGPGAAAT